MIECHHYIIDGWGYSVVRVLVEVSACHENIVITYLLRQKYSKHKGFLKTPLVELVITFKHN